MDMSVRAEIENALCRYALAVDDIDFPAILDNQSGIWRVAHRHLEVALLYK
jgi:hypothetical protein